MRSRSSPRGPPWAATTTTRCTSTRCSAGVRTMAVDSLFLRQSSAHARVAHCIDDELGGAGRFDLIHAHAAVPAAIGRAAIARAGRRVPVIQTMHGWGMSKSATQAAHDIRVMNEVDRLVVPARASASLLESIGVQPGHMAIVPYGVAPSAGAHSVDQNVRRMRDLRRRGELIAICVGTIGERKNQTLLVDAISLVVPAVPIQAVFVGDGDTNALVAHGYTQGVADRVHVFGYQTDARQYPARSRLPGAAVAQ
ncbi:MAG: glycosyltransferase [Vicinamibacterales bacterium]